MEFNIASTALLIGSTLAKNFTARLVVERREQYGAVLLRWYQTRRGNPLVDVRAGLGLPSLSQERFALSTWCRLGLLFEASRLFRHPLFECCPDPRSPHRAVLHCPNKLKPSRRLLSVRYRTNCTFFPFRNEGKGLDVLTRCRAHRHLTPNFRPRLLLCRGRFFQFRSAPDQAQLTG